MKHTKQLNLFNFEEEYYYTTTGSTFKCIHCKEEMPLNEMSTDKYHKVRFECKFCRKENIRIVAQLKKQYGHLRPLLKDACPICKKTGEQILNESSSFSGRRGPWTLDHCHVTKKFRSYICQHCNNGLSGFRDNVETLKKAIEYLKGETQ